jgi:hypothetical protein
VCLPYRYGRSTRSRWPLARGADRVGQRDGELQQLAGVEPARRDQLRQRAPFHQFHRQEADVPDLLNRVDGDDVGVVECGDGLRFTFEALAEIGVPGQARRQYFQGHRPAEPQIAGAVDLPHAAGAERRVYFVRPDPGAGCEGQGRPRGL